MSKTYIYYIIISFIFCSFGSIVILNRKRPEIIIIKEKEEIIKDEITDWLYALRLIESKNDYTARRTGSQYIGAYQVGNDVRSGIGYSHLNNEDGYNEMLNSDLLQDMIMLEHLKLQVLDLEGYLNVYSDTIVGRFYVTSSGILAMAHIAGATGTKKFLDSGGTTISKDGNGVPITDYLQLNNFTLFIDSMKNDIYLTRILDSI